MATAALYLTFYLLCLGNRQRMMEHFSIGYFTHLFIWILETEGEKYKSWPGRRPAAGCGGVGLT